MHFRPVDFLVFKIDHIGPNFDKIAQPDLSFFCRFLVIFLNQLALCITSEGKFEKYPRKELLIRI